MIFLSGRFKSESFPWVDAYRVAKESGNTEIVKCIDHRKSTFIRDELPDYDNQDNTNTINCIATNQRTVISSKEQKGLGSGEILDDQVCQRGTSSSSTDKDAMVQSIAPHSCNIDAEPGNTCDLAEFNDKECSDSKDVAGSEDRSGSSSPEYYYENGLETEV